MTTLLNMEQIRTLFHYRSRSAFHALLSRDRDLQACAIRVGHRLLFDEKRVERYLERHRLIKASEPSG